MRLRTGFAIASISLHFAAGCHSQTAPKSADAVLPLETLKLYETGVGYFERSGTLDAESSMTLPVPTGHLDDALKTMVVLGTGGRTTVGGIEFPSSLSKGMARALAGLPANADEELTYKALLSSLKGTSVEIALRTKAGSDTLTARLIEVVEPKPVPVARDDSSDGDGEKDGARSAAAKPPDLQLLVVTEDGEVRRLEASDVISVKPTDPSFSPRVDSALDALSVKNAQTLKALRLLGTSKTPVTIGYIAEAPIWRSSYRLVMEKTGSRGMLQGWALLHNDTDESWRGVKVELVNGRPDSFLFPLAAPRYSRRPLAEPSEQLATVPQLLETTVDQIWGDNLDTGTIGHGSGTGTGYGYGSGHGRLGGSHRTRAPSVRMGSTQVSASSALSVGNLAEIAPSEGVEAGALFSYKLSQPLDLRAHGSALVPFLQAPVNAKRITWFSTPRDAGRSALRLENATRQTLPAGPIAIYEAGGFAGEAAIERMKPKERAFLQFGVDLDVELELDDEQWSDAPKRLYYDKGLLVEDFVRTHDRKYVITSRSGQPRTVVLELKVVDNSKVEGADSLDYDTASKRALAVFEVPPGKRLEKKLHILEGLQRSNYVKNVSAERLHEVAALGDLPAAQRATVAEAAKVVDEIEKKDKEREETEASITEVNEDLKRLREHLAALGDKSTQPAGANPLVKRILDAEDRLIALRQKLKTLEAEIKAKREATEKLLEKLKKDPADKTIGK